MKNWRIKQSKCAKADIEMLARANQLNPMIAYILTVRGYMNFGDMHNYLYCDINTVPDGSRFKDMAKACSLLLAAIEKKQKIIVFGDYDADGITATSILTMGLRRLGAIAEYYIPQRDTEGYGLNFAAVRELAAQGYSLLLTCDNGISAFEQVQLARDLGMTVIVTDHHELAFETRDNGEIVYQYPAADAIINPKQPDCHYHFKHLCAGEIACKIIQQLYVLCKKDWEQDRLEYLSLAAVATVCDIMDMTDENRTMLRYVIPKLKETPNLGLQALISATGLRDKNITEYHIGFVLGPCINASGRLELANIAVNMFLAEDQQQAEQLALELVRLNNSRKNMSNEGVEYVKSLIEEQNLSDDNVIVVHAPQLTDSIAGIVAGRIKEIYYRPTLVLAGDREIVRGSGRSIEGYNMFECLQACSELLEVFGGHPMAAGLSLKRENIAELRQKLNDNSPLNKADMIPVIYVDAQMAIEKVNNDLAQSLKVMEPFGKGNSVPLFGDKGLHLQRIKLLGNEEKVVRLYFASRNSKNSVSAIMFRQRDSLEQMILDLGGDALWQDLLSGRGNGIMIDMIYTVHINNYNGREFPQIQIEDFRPSTSAIE